MLQDLREIAENMARMQAKQDGQVEGVGAVLGEQLKLLNENAARAQEQFDRQLSELVNATRGEASDALKTNAEATRKYFGALEEGLASLNGILKELDGKQVVIQKPQRRGLFGRKK